MGVRKPEDTRSFALCAHGGAGKTSLAEAMLFDNGNIGRMGNVQNGNTTGDEDLEPKDGNDTDGNSTDTNSNTTTNGNGSNSDGDSGGGGGCNASAGTLMLLAVLALSFRKH